MHQPFFIAELSRSKEGVDFVPHLIDKDSVIGTQVMAQDIDQDGYPEIVVGNKKGTFVHRHGVEEVDRDAWLKAQPKASSPFRPGSHPSRCENEHRRCPAVSFNGA